MKTKLSLITLSTCALAGTTLLADYEKYDGQDLSGQDFYWRIDRIEGDNYISSYDNSSWKNVVLDEADFYHSDESGNYVCSLRESDFYKVEISNTDFSYANLEDARFHGGTVSNVNFSQTNLSGVIVWSSVNFSNVQFTGANLEEVQAHGAGAFSDVDFTNANLSMANFSRNHFSNSIFRGADLTHSFFWEAKLSGCDFAGAIVKGAMFYSSTITLEQLYSTKSYSEDKDLGGVDFGCLNLSSADFSGINLADSSWESTVLKEINFKNADLTNSDFSSADLTGANFSGAKIAGANFTGATLSGSQLGSAKTDWTGIDVHGFDLSALNLTGYTLVDANLSGAVLKTNASFWYTDLTNANLSGAKLEGINFYASTLAGTNFSNAALKGVSFSGAPGYLDGANFTGADLTGARFSDEMTNANFTNANLTDVALGGVVITGSNFKGSNLTLEQLCSTASFDESNTDYWKELSGVGLSGMDLSVDDDDTTVDVSFAGFNLTNTDLSETKLSGVDFSGAIITGTNFEGSDVTLEQLYSTASYTEETFSDESYSESLGRNLSGINLSSQDLSFADFSVNNYGVAVNLTGANFSKANLEKVDFTGANLTGADFSYAELTNGRYNYSPTFDNAIITGANFSCVASNTVDNPYEWAGQYIMNYIRSTASYADKNFSGVGLANVSLSDEDFSGFNLEGANLSGSRMYHTNLTNAILRNTNLEGVCLDYGTLHGTNLMNTNLTGVSWGGTSVARVDFRGAVNAKDEYESDEAVYYYDGDFLRNGLDGKNLILPDGEIYGFSMESSEDSFVIREYVPATEDGEMISAKLVENATISGGAVLTLEEKAVLEILGEKTLTVGDGGSIVVGENAELRFSATDEAVSSIVVSDGGSVTLSASSKIVIDFEGMFSEELTFSVITGEAGASITGLSTNNISLVVNGETYGTSLWDVTSANGSLSFTVQASELTNLIEITNSNQDVILKYDGVRGVFSSKLRDFSGKISGPGILQFAGMLLFKGDASAHTGTTKITAGTFTIAESAKLGTGAYEIAGTLVINGSRVFANATSGNGGISLASGSNVSFAKPIGVKTLFVGEGATLRGGVEMTHGADAELSLAGTLVLNLDKGEKVDLGGGKITLADSAKLDVVGNASAARASATQVAALESGQEVVLVENGTMVGDVVAFLKTDADLLAYSQNCAVVYDATNGLKVKVMKDLTTPVSGVDLSELSESFVDWVLSGTDKILLEENKGFVSVADFGSGLSGGNDPLLKAILGGKAGVARAILDRLSPKSYAAMVAMPVESFNSDVRSISARLEQRRLETFDENTRWEFFAQAQMNSVENDTATDAPTFDFDTYGALAGADYRADKDTTLGVAVGASTGEAKVHNGGGKIESTDFRVAGFAGKTIEKCFVNAGAQLGYASYDIKRSTDYGNASADTTGWSAGLFADARTVITLSEAKKIYATPYVGLAYMHTQADAFTESGSDKAFDADAISGDSLRARLGCGFSWGFAASGAVWRLGLDVAFSHDFLGDEVDIDVTTQDGSSITETAKALPEDMFSIGPSFNVDVSPSSSIYGGYSFNAGTDSSVNHSANVGFRVRF